MSVKIIEKNVRISMHATASQAEERLSLFFSSNICYTFARNLKTEKWEDCWL